MVRNTVRTVSVLSLLTAVSGAVVLTHTGDAGPIMQASANRATASGAGSESALNAALIRSDAAARSSRSATRTTLDTPADAEWRAGRELELQQAHTMRVDTIHLHRLRYLEVKAQRDAHAERVARERKEAVRAKARAAALKQVSRSATRDPQEAARALLASRGWASQFGCLDSLWTRESNWNYQASNPSSGAYGIPQSLPGSKMASAGSDWRTNPMTQMAWGLDYIADRYGSPCGAWAHSESHGWY